MNSTCSDGLGFKNVPETVSKNGMDWAKLGSFKGVQLLATLPWVAPSRAIFQYYGCDTPYRAIHSQEVSAPQKFRGPRMGRWIRGRWICILGAPRLSVQRPPNLILKGFGTIWSKIWGAPNADPTTTDSMPHSRPSEEWCNTPPLVLTVTQTHLCDTPFWNISRNSCATPHKNKHNICFCDAIATSIARYEKYRYWASKALPEVQTF